jgi:thermolabile hemolysin
MLCRFALFLVAASLYAQVPFTQFVVFGDSLSDNGNLYAGTTLRGEPTPGPPMYATGEYTDGTNSVPPTSGPLGLWIEQLAGFMNLPVPQPYAKGGSNYAVAGALTGIDSAFSPTTLNAIPYLTDQLNLFLAAKHTPAVNALYVFWGGSNDILQGVNPATTAASNVQGNIDTLATAGAKYFLWVNLTPLGEVPENINTNNSSALDAESVAYNQAMTNGIAQLKAAHPGITIITLDAYSMFLASTQTPSLYGYTNVMSPAQGFNVNPNTYLFWDTLHPTTVGHNYVAKAAYSAIEYAFGGPSYSCTNTAAPQIASIDSASSYGGYSYFASGSWLEIKGTNLADPADPRLSAPTHPGEWTAADFNGVNAPTVLDDISVSIDGKPAYVWYITPSQLNVQAPEDSTLGSVGITVTNCKATSAPFAFTRQALAPGLLASPTFNVGGTQYLVATFPSDGA